MIDGERVQFGTSGFLYRSNKLMFDRKTETLWHQFRGVPAVGPLVGSGMELEVLPMTLTVWSEWVAEHPDTTVLDLDTGVYPEDAYTPEEQNDSAYFAYRYQSDTIFPVPERSSDLGTKEQVFGLAFGDQARAYPLSLFEGQELVNDTLADRDVVIFAAAPGVGVRAYGRDGHIFTRSPSSTNQEVILASFFAEDLAAVHVTVTHRKAALVTGGLRSHDKLNVFHPSPVAPEISATEIAEGQPEARVERGMVRGIYSLTRGMKT